MSKPGGLSPRKYFFVILFEIVSSQILTFYKRVVRYALHIITGRTELERICLNEKVESTRIRKIETNLLSSKNKYLRDSVTSSTESTTQENEEIIALNIMKIKNIKQDNNLNLLIMMKDGLIKIKAYNKLLNELDDLRRKKFSFDNCQDSEKLTEFWDSLKGKNDQLDSKISKRWTELGFQGKDPSTDFRGMGMLAVVNLHCFSTTYKESALQVYSKSLHPKFGYPFAIVGINITSWIYHLLSEGYLKTHFYNDSALLARDKINLSNFNRIYCTIFIEFDSFWFTNEPNVMDFERLSKIFQSLITEKLKNDPHSIIRENFLGKNYKISQLNSS